MSKRKCCFNCEFFPHEDYDYDVSIKGKSRDNYYCKNIRVLHSKKTKETQIEPSRTEFDFETAVLCNERNKNYDCDRYKSALGCVYVFYTFAIFIITILFLNFIGSI